MNLSFNFKPPEKLQRILTSKKVVRFVGLLFMTIGFTMSFFAAKMHIDAKDAKTWIPHFANIQSAKLREYHDDNGFKSYSVDVTYRYSWETIAYEGNQYRLHNMSSSGFDENNEIVQDLRQAMEQGEEYPIFVNPNNPKESAVKNVVDPESKLVAI